MLTERLDSLPLWPPASSTHHMLGRGRASLSPSQSTAGGWPSLGAAVARLQPDNAPATCTARFSARPEGLSARSVSASSLTYSKLQRCQLLHIMPSRHSVLVATCRAARHSLPMHGATTSEYRLHPVAPFNCFHIQINPPVTPSTSCRFQQADEL